MLNAYEQRLVAFYLANAASSPYRWNRVASDLADWVADRENRMVLREQAEAHRRFCAAKGGRDDGIR